MGCLYWLKLSGNGELSHAGRENEENSPRQRAQKAWHRPRLWSCNHHVHADAALACTQIYMGGKLTADGNTYYGRAEDFGKRYLKHYGIEPAHEPGFKYSSIESAFEYTSNKPTYRYSYVRDHPSNWMGRTDAYSEAGINEKGVSCSATLSTSYNEEAAAADSSMRKWVWASTVTGSIILGESATAREGVELLGSLIDDQASAPTTRSSSPTTTRPGCSPHFPPISGSP